MDRYLPPWTYWLLVGGVPAQWLYGLSETAPVVPAAPAVPAVPVVPPSELDLRLIHLAYGIVAAESRCTRCGAPLADRLRVVAWTGRHRPSWTVSVVTRCCGPWRHRHVAAIDEVSNDLVLGPLHAG